MGCSTNLFRWDHPRACGENFLPCSPVWAVCGSPPRMRGKLVTYSIGIPGFGITPAHAGKTGLWLKQEIPIEDHPRACGENAFSMLNAAARTGSPPRMRGKLTLSISFPLCFRITPAHAGKTYLNCACFHLFQDHPRACGENSFECTIYSLYQGSPPRMRGKRCSQQSCYCMPRITPAHAGKTFRM